MRLLDEAHSLPPLPEVWQPDVPPLLGRLLEAWLGEHLLLLLLLPASLPSGLLLPSELLASELVLELLASVLLEPGTTGRL